MDEKLMNEQTQRTILGLRDEVVYFERRLSEARTNLSALLAQIGVQGLQIMAVPHTPEQKTVGTPS